MSYASVLDYIEQCCSSVNHLEPTLAHASKALVPNARGVVNQGIIVPPLYLFQGITIGEIYAEKLSFTNLHPLSRLYYFLIGTLKDESFSLMSSWTDIPSQMTRAILIPVIRRVAFPETVWISELSFQELAELYSWMTIQDVIRWCLHMVVFSHYFEPWVVEGVLELPDIDTYTTARVVQGKIDEYYADELTVGSSFIAWDSTQMADNVNYRIQSQRFSNAIQSGRIDNAAQFEQALQHQTYLTDKTFYLGNDTILSAAMAESRNMFPDHYKDYLQRPSSLGKFGREALDSITTGNHAHKRGGTGGYKSGYVHTVPFKGTSAREFNREANVTDNEAIIPPRPLSVVDSIQQFYPSTAYTGETGEKSLAAQASASSSHVEANVLGFAPTTRRRPTAILPTPDSSLALPAETYPNTGQSQPSQTTLVNKIYQGASQAASGIISLVKGLKDETAPAQEEKQTEPNVPHEKVQATLADNSQAAIETVTQEEQVKMLSGN